MGQSSVSRRCALRAVGLSGTLDVTPSRTGDHVLLHVANTDRTPYVNSAFRIDGGKITGGRVHWLDLDPESEVFEYGPECVFQKEKALNLNLPWAFPVASVSAVELSADLHSRGK